jgi:hypothetical protein
MDVIVNVVNVVIIVIIVIIVILLLILLASKTRICCAWMRMKIKVAL